MIFRKNERNEIFYGTSIIRNAVNIFNSSKYNRIFNNVFRHKTKKLQFTVGLPVITILEILGIIYFWWIFK